MRMIASILSLLVLSLTLASCKDSARMSYLELSGRILIFNPRMATATFVVTLNVLKSPPIGSKVIAAFDDPAGGSRLEMEQPVRDGQTKVAFESPSLFCIKKDTPYNFDVDLLASDGVSLQRISSSITSTLDQSVLPEVPLVEGPGYALNRAAQSSQSAQALQQQACPA
jgi:hypothetical protein